MLSDHLTPIDYDLEREPGTLGHHVDPYRQQVPQLAEGDIAIIGLPLSSSSEKPAQKIREQFYSLSGLPLQRSIRDFGDLADAGEREQNHAHLTEVLQHLSQKGGVIILIGGTQDFTLAQHQSLHNPQLTIVDQHIDWKRGGPFPATFLEELFEPDFPPFTYHHLGHQSHFITTEQQTKLDEIGGDRLRLGEIREDLPEVEPVIRDTQLLSWDLGALRSSDAPGVLTPTPNGLFGEEACQLSRYAGLSPRLNSIGFYNFTPRHDSRHLTAQLVAQMAWYFLDGLTYRHADHPATAKEEFVKYSVQLDHQLGELIFWNSPHSNRWWLEPPFEHETNGEQLPQYLSCSYRDYQRAAEEGKLPNRLLKFYQHLNR